MTAPMRPQDGRHRRARLSLRARERLELMLLFAGILGVAAVLAVVLGGAVRALLDRECAPIVVESTGTWQHDHAAEPGPDPDWGTYDCVTVVGLVDRQDLSTPVPVGESTP